MIKMNIRFVTLFFILTLIVQTQSGSFSVASPSTPGLNAFQDTSGSKTTYRLNEAGSLNLTLSPSGGLLQTYRKPVDIVLVLDTSGSMLDPLGGSSRLTSLKSSAKNFVDYLTLHGIKGDRIILETFNEYAVVHTSYSYDSGFKGLKTAIDGVIAGGGTNYQDGLLKASETLKNSTNTKNIVFFSDGLPMNYNPEKLYFKYYYDSVGSHMGTKTIGAYSYGMHEFIYNQVYHLKNGIWGYGKGSTVQYENPALGSDYFVVSETHMPSTISQWVAQEIPEFYDEGDYSSRLYDWSNGAPARRNTLEDNSYRFNAFDEITAKRKALETAVSIRSSGIRIHSISLSSTTDENKVFQDKLMTDLVGTTGIALKATNSTELNAAFQKVGSSISKKNLSTVSVSGRLPSHIAFDTSKFTTIGTKKYVNGKEIIYDASSGAFEVKFPDFSYDLNGNTPMSINLDIPFKASKQGSGDITATLHYTDTQNSPLQLTLTPLKITVASLNKPTFKASSEVTPLDVDVTITFDDLSTSMYYAVVDNKLPAPSLSAYKSTANKDHIVTINQNGSRIYAYSTLTKNGVTVQSDLAYYDVNNIKNTITSDIGYYYKKGNIAENKKYMSTVNNSLAIFEVNFSTLRNDDMSLRISTSGSDSNRLVITPMISNLIIYDSTGKKTDYLMTITNNLNGTYTLNTLQPIPKGNYSVRITSRVKATNTGKYKLTILDSVAAGMTLSIVRIPKIK